MTEERKAYYRAYFAKNKAKHYAAVRRWAVNNPEKVKASQRKSKLKNRAKSAVTAKAWRIRNPDKVKAHDRQKRLRHKDKILARQRRWYEQNRERKQAQDQERYLRLREETRLRTAQWYRDNPERARAARKEWRDSNPEKVAAMMVHRKARERAATVADCTQRVLELRRESHCHWCRRELTKSNRSIDHVIPLARGGLHRPENLVAACRPCNSSKNARLPSEWSPLIAAA